MARLNRLCPVGITQHIIQRGNNRHVCFNGDEDIASYVNRLKEFSENIKCKLCVGLLPKEY